MSKFIGIVSAYAYAVSQGYTGTEEEYAELMASYATVAEQATESAQASAARSADAQDSAEEARQSASIASTRAIEADTAAGASIDAKNDAITAKTAAETAQGKAEDAQAAAAQSASEAAESARTLTIDATLKQSGQAADAKAVGDEIDSLKSAVTHIKDITLDVNYGNNLINPADLTPNKVVAWQTGAIVDTTGYNVTGFIPVIKDVLYGYTGYEIFFGFYTSKDLSSFVSETSTNDITELDGGKSTTTAYTVPVVWFKAPINGFIRVSIPSYNIANSRQEFFAIRDSSEIVGTNFPGYTDGQYQINSVKNDVVSVNARVDNLLQNIEGKKNSYVYDFDMNGGTTYVRTIYVEDMCNYRLAFFGLFSGTFSGELVVGKGANLEMGGSIKIDNENIYMYFGGNPTAQRTQPHGLTLKDYISVVIDIGFSPVTKVILSTNGGTYTWDLPYFRSWREILTVYSSAVSYTNCTLSYVCASIFTDTWLYGDSYFANSSTDRWTNYLVSNGYKNYLLNAYPGRNSEQALQALNADLAMQFYPKRIVWCLGMNDPDNGAANASWLETISAVKAICDEHHIELILATIPLVPNQNYDNTYKNAYVKSSGLRYIDFAKAVNSSGAAWYDGMINQDNIHPDTPGAIALFSAAVGAVPELLT